LDPPSCSLDPPGDGPLTSGRLVVDADAGRLVAVADDRGRVSGFAERTAIGRVEEGLHLGDGFGVAGQVLEQALLEQPVEQRIDHRRRHCLRLSGELGKPADDAPDHVFQALVDLGHVVAERRFEKRLGANVVPQTMHMRFFAHGVAEALQKALHQLVVGRRSRRDLIVARHASRLVLPHAAQDQVDLVVEVVVQHPVGEFRVLGDLAQTGAGVAQLRERLQRRLGELGSALGEFVHPPRNSVEFGH